MLKQNNHLNSFFGYKIVIGACKHDGHSDYNGAIKSLNICVVTYMRLHNNGKKFHYYFTNIKLVTRSHPNGVESTGIFVFHFNFFS